MIKFKNILNWNLVICFVLSIWGLDLNAQHKIINSGWQYSEDKTSWQTVNIPHTWNLKDAFDDTPGYRRGLGYYRKQLFIASEENNKIHYLKFNAVNQEATVFVNGKEVGNHKGGYTAFNFDITSYINFNEFNLIEVTVDNSHNLDIPPLDADFTFYGGIYRDVELLTLPKQHFDVSDYASDGFYVNYYDVSKEKAGVEVAAILNNVDSIDVSTNLKLNLFDAEGNLVKSRKEELKLFSDTSNEFVIKLPLIYDPHLWSPDSPYLYKLKIEFTDVHGNLLEVKSANIGFRWASLDSEKGFYLNGEPIKLIGVNRHQDYKDYGNAVPLDIQKKDIEIIKNMGANVIRFAHYPHRRELYDLCDKLGIIVWTEIPIVNKVTNSKTFFDVSINMQKEHIKQYYNYPSVVMFGYMNEIFLRLAFDNKSTAEVKEDLKVTTMDLANQLETLTRTLAPNHLTVMACHLNDIYNETGIANLPMVLGWNLYFGWYDKGIEDLGIFLDEQQSKYPNRSLLLSEYGPGADVRIYTKTPKKFDFSTDYQAKLHQSYYKQITDRPYMTGMTAWNFSDFGSEFRGDAIPYVNQKGLVQYDRTPKDIYYWYKSVLDKKHPFVHVATTHLSGLTLIDESTYPVQLYSNQPKGDVYLNNNKLQELSFENGFASMNVPFKNGKNTIKVISGNVSDEKIVEVNKISALDFKQFNRLGINVGSHFNFSDEERNITFVPDQPYIKGWFGYMDGEMFKLNPNNHQGIPHNIRNSNSEPLFQTMLEGCTKYKVDLPNGQYRVHLYFVEPQIKSTENIYNLSKGDDETILKKQRVFNVYLNSILVEDQFNLAEQYPEKYGVELSSTITVQNGDGLNVYLKSVEGKPVLSGVLIEKID
ncbi:glycoside hydrolase family 2 [Gaetbulibacter saemankumensis]|uniref:glycoside hydrolase family 2 n=1 Tax=Gaetbulibacter saemankumensis TaxID=311208 RepID=UPI0006868CD4|nr:glycoside hydrolase family 2 [Gaetbulibacter saemankumensis]